ncbi:MAG: hydroxymethylpyrimidine/phosphomethylpyrimidine kinase [Acidobacteria bacterium]|nr:hydroxymethylpyrimidine/phosphomethylpyrimidine kinase [Acidobacteriota bacterium]
MAPATALTVHAADPTGTGGLQGDLAVFAALGVRCASVVTAVAARTGRAAGVLHELPAAAVRAQLEALAEGPLPSAAKVGFLSRTPVVRLVAADLVRRRIPYVVDPVLVSRSGPRLLAAPSWAAFLKELLPSAALVTPNLPEASLLAGFPIRGEGDAKRAARAIQAYGPRAVLIKGGHADGDVVVDGLLDGRTWRAFAAPRLGEWAVPGAGDTLSAAITAYLAGGETLPDAVEHGLAFVRRAIAAAL